MTQIATITSKRQITIPISIFKKTGLKRGEKVIVTSEEGTIKMQPASDLIDELAGSVKTPLKYKNLSTNEIVSESKKDYFSQK